jgi:hypothetical protein
MSARSVAAWCLVLLPVAVYVGWCTWGFHRLGQVSSNKSPWVASHALGKGHRLAVDDVARAPDSKFEHPSQSRDRLIGRYLKKNLAKDAAVSLADLAAQPIIDPVANSLIYFAPLESTPELRPYLDAGSRLTLCWSNSKACIPDRLVIAVSCDGKNACVAITSIPVDQLDRMEPSGKLQLLLHR